MCKNTDLPPELNALKCHAIAPLVFHILNLISIINVLNPGNRLV